MHESWMYDVMPPASVEGQTLPCRGADPEIFFAQEPVGIRRAKEVCAPCPSRIECLAGALSRGEPWGVWGGELFLAGVVIAHKRQRGRPRKNEAA